MLSPALMGAVAATSNSPGKPGMGRIAQRSAKPASSGVGEARLGGARRSWVAVVLAANRFNVASPSLSPQLSASVRSAASAVDTTAPSKPGPRSTSAGGPDDATAAKACRGRRVGISPNFAKTSL